MLQIKNHKTLNPKIWLPDNSLRPEVAEMLNRIYISLMTVLSIYYNIPMDLERDVVDVILCGSSKEYFYSKKSDIDIDIILRPDRYLEKIHPDLLIKFNSFIRTFFTNKYSPKINGISVDIGFISRDFDFVRYSLIQKKWLRNPKKYSDKELKIMRYKTNLYYLAMKKMINSVLKDKTRHKELSGLYSHMKNRRLKSWDDYSIGMVAYSLAFAHLKRNGIINKLLKADEAYMKRMMTDLSCNPY
ncbi:MAG: hypothetical protein JW974_02235 [Alphaproteobacteria bacterium]|nr:hypothetical protein [Alphaproteobacteria bacterium]MBN2675039.1 hypothetical protein [Alphaproteobacteria bacterium]